MKPQIIVADARKLAIPSRCSLHARSVRKVCLGDRAKLDGTTTLWQSQNIRPHYKLKPKGLLLFNHCVIIACIGRWEYEQ